MGATMADRPARRCRLLVAAAGYGKTTALRQWYPAASALWYARDEVAALLSGDLPTEGQLVLDDVPRLDDTDAERLLELIEGLPATASVAISSRWPLGASLSRWRGRGLLSEAGPADIALTQDGVEAVLAAEYGLHDPDLAERLHEVTAGWPALVHLAAESIARDGIPRQGLLPALAEPGTALAQYLEEEVLNGLPDEARAALAEISDLIPASVPLAVALGHTERSVRLLAGTGLLMPGPGGLRVVPVLASLFPRGASDRRIAAQWYDQNGPAAAAASAYAAAGEHTETARVLAQHGETMLGDGHAATLAGLLENVPSDLRTRELRLLHGDALRTLGDVMGAERAYDAVARHEVDWDAALAWRMGLTCYLRGDSVNALATFARVRSTVDSPDLAQLLAWQAAAYLQAGDVTLATEVAQRAYRCAAKSGHDGALANAHISLALCLGMSANPADSDEQYAQALRIAERTGDLVLLARILTNQTYHLLREGRYAAARDAAREAGRYATAAGHANLRTIAGCNEADALTMLGRYDEAVRQYDRVLARCRRMGSRRAAAALLGLAEVHRRRGWREQARAAYEEAARAAEESGHNQVLVMALAGLALVLLTDDPKAAAAHAERASRLAMANVTVPALLAQGWVARQAADPQGAAAFATEAARIARAQRDRAGLAEALELRAAVETDPAKARASLREAHAIWIDTGAEVDAARTLLTLGGLTDATTDERLGALLAAERLAAAGAPVPPTATDQPSGGEVAIRALGRFEVQLGDRVVPPAQWQSRKARDLLRILVARRGRPVPRAELCELLWPDDDPSKTGHRLSVLLSIVRGVLDPYKAYATDHFLVADAASIALDVTRVRIDVEDFLADVAHGRRLRDRGALAEARTLLSAAERNYRADAFEDEPYADWSGPLREEARAAYLSALRILAQASRAARDTGAAVSYLLRLLERDPYDEAGHRALIETLAAAGQHGEARRAYLRYAEAMRSIGVRPYPKYQEPIIA